MKNNLCLFQNTEEWCFSFWNIFFRFRDIDILLLCKFDQWWRHVVATKMWKILNKRYLWKYWSSVLETWHHKCTSQKKQNDTLSAVSIATLLAPVSFCQKAKNPHLQPLRWDRGSYLNRNSSHIVFSPVIRLGGVDNSCFKAKSGITVFINTAPAAKLLSWQQH